MFETLFAKETFGKILDKLNASCTCAVVWTGSVGHELIPEDKGATWDRHTNGTTKVTDVLHVGLVAARKVILSLLPRLVSKVFVVLTPFCKMLGEPRYTLKPTVLLEIVEQVDDTLDLQAVGLAIQVVLPHKIPVIPVTSVGAVTENLAFCNQVGRIKIRGWVEIKMQTGKQVIRLPLGESYDLPLTPPFHNFQNFGGTSPPITPLPIGIKFPHYPL